jgi:hypothetical protein
LSPKFHKWVIGQSKKDQGEAKRSKKSRKNARDYDDWVPKSLASSSVLRILKKREIERGRGRGSGREREGGINIEEDLESQIFFLEKNRRLFFKSIDSVSLSLKRTHTHKHLHERIKRVRDYITAHFQGMGLS